MPRTLTALALLALPLAAAAQTTYRCTGKDGKKYYGESVPTACLGMPVEQLNAQGLVVKRIDAQATAAEREKKEAEEVERKKREAVSKEEGRRDRALLATYTSEADIDQARARALKDNQVAITDLEARIALLKKKRAEPGADTKGIDVDLKAQEELLAVKKKDSATINARYDDDKKRYAELTKKK